MKATVTIEGPQGSGKSLIADLLKDALFNAGASFISEDSVEGRTAICRYIGVEIHITEKLVD